MGDYQRTYEQTNGSDPKVGWRAIFVVVAAIGALHSAAQAQTPTVSAVVNGATQATGPIAPGMDAEMFGTNLAASLQQWCGASTGAYPTTCNGVSISVNGKASPLFFIGDTAITFQIPVDISGSTAAIQLTRQTGGQTLQSNIFSATVAPTAPGLFTTAVGGLNLVTALDSSYIQITASNPARPGDTLIVYGTGLGPTNPIVPSGSVAPSTPVPVTAAVTATMGGKSAVVVFAGLFPGSGLGVNLINLKVPVGL